MNHLRQLTDSYPITVGAVIQLLKDVDQNLIFLIEDYESGVTGKFRITKADVVKDSQHKPCSGEYVESFIDSDGDRYPYYLESAVTEFAIVLSWRASPETH